MESTWGDVILRAALLSLALSLLYLWQRFWFVRAWRLAVRLPSSAARALIRGVCVAAALFLLAYVVDGVIGPHRRIFVRGSWLAAVVGLWLSTSLVAALGVKTVAGVEWLWRRVAGLVRGPAPAASEPADPSRRYFFQTASYLAGALPFIGAVYGFAAERLRFQVRSAELPLAGLPVALDGLRIVQLSDIHIGGYMPPQQVRRAVEMANELRADLAVVTGDFITGVNDPLETCIAELARLRAPLGVWGCNGNHEIYVDVEAAAAELFRKYGMRLLRRENAQLGWRGAAFNLIGVDYQRSRLPGGRRPVMLQHVEPLVRRDIPNILLSHNPNAFPRAAELGIELMLAGHTHGGQVQVEILDRRLNPARFITNYIAGLYSRPLHSPASDPEALAPAGRSSHASGPTSLLYVNRGLGTIGAPVRIGVPPEITLLTLRRS